MNAHNLEKTVDIVFDGPPGPSGGRFIEVEDSEGKGVSLGEWVQRPDGYWALRIAVLWGPEDDLRQRCQEDAIRLLDEARERFEGLDT